MASRTVLSLYKNMMREAGKFTDVNFRYGFNLFRREFLDRTTQFFVPKPRLFSFIRSYTLRRVRDEFKASKSISDPAEISKQLSFARSNLDLIKRQVWLSTFRVCRFKTPFSFIGFQMRLILISGYDRTSFWHQASFHHRKVDKVTIISDKCEWSSIAYVLSTQLKIKTASRYFFSDLDFSDIHPLLWVFLKFRHQL